MNTNIRLKGAPNFRDLGGYPTADGRRVRCGKLFRSDGLSRLTTEDYASLRDLGIRLICDLRSDLERRLKPTVWPAHLVPTTLVMDVNADLRAGNSDLFDMLRKDPTERGVRAMMTYVYRFVPDALTKHLGNFFSLVADAGHLPLILHCSAGKDRTGVLSAILLWALGVPRETVLEDYLKTSQYHDGAKLKATVVELMGPILGRPPSPEMIKIMSGVEAAYIDTAIDSIRLRYDSVESYLESSGVGESQLAEFRSLMLE